MVYNEQIRIAPYNGEWFLDDVVLNWIDITEQFIVSLTVPIPTAKKYEIDVPGRHGTLDLTDVLDGVKYNNRLCKLKLVAMATTTDADIKTFIRAYNGKRCVIDVQAEGYKLIGRFAVLDKKEQKAEKILTCEFDAEPLKVISDVRKRLYPLNSVHGNQETTQLIPGSKSLELISNSGALNLQLSDGGGGFSYNQANAATNEYYKKAVIKFKISQAPTTQYIILKSKFKAVSNGTEVELSNAPYWAITNAAGDVLLDSSNETQMFFNSFDDDNLYLNVTSEIGDKTVAQEVTLSYEFEMSSVYPASAYNDGMKTTATYITAAPSGLFRIWVNNGSALNKNIYGSGIASVTDPRLIIRNGNNYACVVAVKTISVTDPTFVDIVYRVGDPT